MSATPARPGRSRARLGADHARVWARGLRLGNPHAKAVLLAVANYMNEDGVAWPGIVTISEDTDLSEDTVVNRLRWLESIGAIALFKAWVDENGRRNLEGRGRVTSSEIRFLFDADTDEISARANPGKSPPKLRGAAAASHAAAKDASHADEPDVGTRHGREQNSSHLQPVSTGLAPDSPPTAAARTEEPELEDSPQAPQGGLTPDGWEDFKAAFEADGSPIMRVSIAKERFAALNPDERARATRAARGLIAHRAKDKRPPSKPAAQVFLTELEAWPAFEKLDPGDPGSAGQQTHCVPEDSPEGRAWWALTMLCGLSKPYSFTFQGQIVFALPAALSRQALALADCVDPRGRRIGQWVIVDPRSNAFGAWRQLVTEITGRPFNPRGGVPATFPPRADGTWPEFNLSRTG